MITVELQVPEEQTAGYRTAATLQVHDDRTWTVSGDKHLVDPQLRVLDPVQGEFVTLEQDPARWARYLGTALRTAYLVPVVTEDTDTR